MSTAAQNLELALMNLLSEIEFNHRTGATFVDVNIDSVDLEAAEVASRDLLELLRARAPLTPGYVGWRENAIKLHEINRAMKEAESRDEFIREMSDP